MNKKISRFISAIVFLILFSAMSLNYAMAYEELPDLEYDFIGNILPPSRSYDDVSNGYTYYLWKGRNADVYNWAYEWGYAYAGLEAIISSDNFWAKGAFNAS